MVKVETGYGATTVDTEYGPCACNPLGKMSKQSAPFGNPVTVEEPGGLFIYNTYTAQDKLATVSMTRNGVTQTRTFTWEGGRLLSATNPESGTEVYGYDLTGRLTTRVAAKGSS